MPLFKRVISEADQFRTKETSSQASPDIALDANGQTGIYKKTDTEIAMTLDGSDAFNLRKGQISLTLSPAEATIANTIFISGGSLQFRGGGGTITRLAVP